MANKFLISDLSTVYSKTPKLKNDSYALVELSGMSYKAPYDDVFKDVLSNRLKLGVSRPEPKGPNKLSAMFIDDNSTSVCLTSISLQDGMLSTFDFNSSTNVLSLYFNTTDPASNPLTVDLNTLKDIYYAGHGITLSSNSSGQRFNANDSMTTFTFPSGSKTSYAIDGTLTKDFIGGVASFTSIKLGSTVDSIGNAATSTNKSNLSSVLAPFGIKSIGQQAFINASHLARVEIGGNQLSSIDNYAFQGCTGLTAVILPDSTVRIGQSAFNGCSSLSSFSIPQNALSIEELAFASCSELRSIEIPSNILFMGDGALQECTMLTNVILPEGMTSIVYSTFKNCTSLPNVEIPSTVSSIETYAFQNCSSLTCLEIPPSVNEIQQDAFAGCTNLLSIIFKNKSQIPSGQPWGATNAVVAAFNDASQEWVKGQNYLTSSDISAEYANDQHIYLSANRQVVGDIDCSAFLKDGMLSNVQLSDDQLVFEFNSDANRNDICVALSNFIDKSLYKTYSSTVSSLSNDGYALSSNISKVFIKDPSVSAYEDGKQSDLSVIKIAESEYMYLVSANATDPNALYVVSTDFINAYGQKIRNVDAPELSDDAATKGYVDNATSNMSHAMSSMLSGKTYDFSTMSAVYQSLSDIICTFGGTISNFPTFNA